MHLNKVILKSSFVVLCTVISLGSYTAHAMYGDLDEAPLSHNARVAIESLSNSTPFAYFDLDLSSSESDSLRRVKVNESLFIKKVDGILENLEDEAKAFITQIGWVPAPSLCVPDTSDNTEIAVEVAQVITRLVNKLVIASAQETARVDLRSFAIPSGFISPSWHRDTNSSETPHKFTIALRGAPTLFYNLPVEKEQKFYELFTQSNRSEIPSLLGGDRAAISSPQLYQGAVFKLGFKHGAVHSTPAPITEQRVFLGITPCSKADIQKSMEAREVITQ